MHRPVLRIARTAALLGTALTSLPALAQNATWNGATSDYNLNTNWNPAVVPTNLATFDAAGSTSVDINAPASVNAFQYLPTAQSFFITNTSSFDINGIGALGMVNDSAFLQVVVNFSTMTFNNGATVTGGNQGIILGNVTQAGGLARLTFNNSSGIDLHTQLVSFGESASATGTSEFGSLASVTFNDDSHAIGATIVNIAGDASGEGAAGTSGFANGGSAFLDFDDNSSADNSNIISLGGSASAFSGDGGGFALGGLSTVTLRDTAHADGATIAIGGNGAFAQGDANGASAEANTGQSRLSLQGEAHANLATITLDGGVASGFAGPGGEGSGSDGAIGGDAFVRTGATAATIGDLTSVDGSIFTIGGGSITLVGGDGGLGGSDGGLGGNGGAAGAQGSLNSLLLFSAAHADGATFDSTAGSVSATGGIGGDGPGDAGGDGGAALANGAATSIIVANDAHAFGATISNSGSDATGVGGAGGDASAAGASSAGGAGGNADALGGSATFAFLGTFGLGANGAITNQGGDAVATGGAGGNGSAALGGLGGTVTSVGGSAIVVFTAGAGPGNATIVNTAGNATAVGGAGGDGGPGADGGAGGGAFTTGGNAQINFFETSSAETATITNIAGVGSASGGAAGAAGPVGAIGVGGAGGGAAAAAGVATVNFNENSTAGQAHITNGTGTFTVFRNSSTGGTSVIANTGGTTLFLDTSNAQGAAITNGATGNTTFNNSSTAGSASITNAGLLQFFENSTGGTATIQNNGTGILDINDSADLVGVSVTQAITANTFLSETTTGTRIGALAGNGNVVLGARLLQVGARNLTTTFAGVISGTGSLTKVGTGTLVLSGQNTYTGPTAISAGALQVDGRITSSVSVGAGGTLTGRGTIAGNVANSGVVVPGTSASPLSTLIVSGNFTNNNGVFVSTVDPSGAGSLLSAGTATLNGGTVQVFSSPGMYGVQTDYRIIGTTGGRTGTFTTLNGGSLPTSLNASLFYTANDVFLRIRRSSVSFAQTAGLTPNQAAAALALDQTFAAGNPLVFTTYAPLYNALLFAPGQVASNLSLVSGDALASHPLVESAAADRFNDRMSEQASDDLVAGPHLHLWGTMNGVSDEFEGDANGPRGRAHSLDFQVGFGYQAGPNTVIGVSAGHGSSDVDVNSRFASGDVDTTSVGAYFQHLIGGFYMAGQFSYHWHKVDSDRALLNGGLATASYDAKSLAANGEFGMSVIFSGFSVEPHLRARYARTRQDVFTEAGGVGVLNVDSDNFTDSRVGIGLRVVDRNPDAGIRPYGLISYEREVGDDHVALTNTLPGLGSFRVVSTELGKDIFSARIGITSQFGAFSLFSVVGASLRQNASSQYAVGGVKFAW